MIKLLLSDFDGTLTVKDSLDVICSINGSEMLSKKINDEYLMGLDTKNDSIERRVRLLAGLSVNSIEEKLNESYLLRKDVMELFSFLQKRNIKVVICSGNIMPILNYYALKLNVTEIIGNEIEIKENILTGNLVKKMENGFKERESKKVILKYGLKFEEIAVLGDSISDLGMMRLGKYKYFIDPKNNVEKCISNVTVVGDIKDFINKISNL